MRPLFERDRGRHRVGRRLGHWALAEVELGRAVLPAIPRLRQTASVYAVASLRWGVWPLVQYHAWVNSEGTCGGYWQVGRGRWHVTVGTLARYDFGAPSPPGSRHIRIGPTGLRWLVVPSITVGQRGSDVTEPRWRSFWREWI